MISPNFVGYFLCKISQIILYVKGFLQFEGAILNISTKGGMIPHATFIYRSKVLKIGVPAPKQDNAKPWKNGNLGFQIIPWF